MLVDVYTTGEAGAPTQSAAQQSPSAAFRASSKLQKKQQPAVSVATAEFRLRSVTPNHQSPEGAGVAFAFWVLLHGQPDEDGVAIFQKVRKIWSFRGVRL
jgi:hypothetical protein